MTANRLRRAAPRLLTSSISGGTAVSANFGATPRLMPASVELGQHDVRQADRPPRVVHQRHADARAKPDRDEHVAGVL